MTDETTTDAPTSQLKYGEWTVDANTLPPKAVAYLLHNGFTQSMTDAAAFTKKQKEEAVKDHPESEHETILANMAKDARQKRFDAILKGEVGVRVGGPRKSPLDRATDDIVDEMLAAIAAQRKVAMPKGDVLAKAREAIRNKFSAEIAEKAAERVAQSSQLVADAGDLGF